MRGEECSCPFFRVLGGRLVVFDQVANSAAAGLQDGNIEGMVGVRADLQSNRRAVGPRMGNHLATAFRWGPVVLFARIKVGAVNVTNGRRQAGK
jgi:hypothetical protein